MPDRATIPAWNAGPARLAYVADGFADTAWDIETETRAEHRAQRERLYRETRAGYAACELALIDRYVEAFLDARRAKQAERALLDRVGATSDSTDLTILHTSLVAVRYRTEAARERMRSAKARILNQGLPGDDAEGAGAGRWRRERPQAAE